MHIPVYDANLSEEFKVFHSTKPHVFTAVTQLHLHFFVSYARVLFCVDIFGRFII